jgi:TPR repeat protein
MKLPLALAIVLALCAACAAPQQRLNVADLRAKVEHGDPNAAVAMGVLYDSGTEVAKDQSEAARWYRLAADKGNAEAQNSLGSMYQAGEGVPRDYSLALRWYSLAADQGHGKR